jgi:hypothetical protein
VSWAESILSALFWDVSEVRSDDDQTLRFTAHVTGASVLFSFVEVLLAALSWGVIFLEMCRGAEPYVRGL